MKLTFKGWRVLPLNESGGVAANVQRTRALKRPTICRSNLPVIRIMSLTSVKGKRQPSGLVAAAISPPFLEGPHAQGYANLYNPIPVASVSGVF